MNNNDENKLVPKLRFPEFKDSGEWEKKLLRQVSDVISGQSPAGESYNEEGIGTPFYQGKTDFGDIFLKEPTMWTTEPTKFANTGDILMSVRAPVGALNISNQVICIGRGLSAIQSKDEKLYLFYFLNRIQNKIIGNGGSVFDSINKEQIEKINILIPKKLEEQQKIATCLSSLDEVITAESQKLELLKEHKKGLLQNLFPQEGETVPKLRFSEFKDDGKWKDVTIDSIGEVITGGTPSKEEEEYWGGDFVWVTAQDLKDKYISDSVLKLTQKGKEKSRIIPKYSVLVTCIASIGLNGINKVECATNQQINAIVCNSRSHYEFVYYSITQNEKRLKNMASQTAVPIINKSVFEKFIIHKPKSISEQQKIADCLSSIDDFIKAQTEKIEQLKLHKKGLLQGLFPEVNTLNK